MEIDLAQEMVDSEIVQIQLLSEEEVQIMKKVLKYDDDFNFDLMMLMKQKKSK